MRAAGASANKRNASAFSSPSFLRVVERSIERSRGGAGREAGLGGKGGAQATTTGRINCCATILRF